MHSKSDSNLKSEEEGGQVSGRDYEKERERERKRERERERERENVAQRHSASIALHTSTACDYLWSLTYPVEAETAEQPSCFKWDKD